MNANLGCEAHRYPANRQDFPLAKRRASPLPNQPMDTQRQDEEHSADADAHQQRMFGATKAASKKTGNAHNGSDRKSSSHSQSAGLSSHTRIVGQHKENARRQV